MQPLVAFFVVQSVGLAEVFRLALVNGAIIALAFLLIHVVFRRFFAPRKIQPTGFSGPILRHELLFSLSTLLIGGAIGVLTVHLVQRGAITVAYGRTGAGRVVLEAVAYFLAFDLYYYLLHVGLHTGPMYDWVHAVHHRSMTPNPLTGFSIHPVEAVLSGAFLPLVLVLVDLHLYTVIVVSAHAGLNTVFLHTGHEVFPRWWYRSRLSAWYVTPAFHDAHHSEVSGNYGVHTAIWDRIFGTIQSRFRPRPSPLAASAA